MRRDEIARLLPYVFQRTLKPNTPLDALLAAMEELHRPSESVLAELDRAFDPRRTRDAFVPLLARWVNLEWLFDVPRRIEGDDAPDTPLSTGLGRLRELVAQAAWLSQWRGTNVGLTRFLETATGCLGFEIAEQVDRTGAPRPFHVVVRAPGAAAPHRALIERIVRTDKPAYVTYEIEFSQEAAASRTRA